MSAFQNIVKTAVEQLNTFYAAQLELAHKSLDNYDEHIETASNIKKSEITECCNDALKDLKYQLNELQIKSIKIREAELQIVELSKSYVNTYKTINEKSQLALDLKAIKGTTK